MYYEDAVTVEFVMSMSLFSRRVCVVPDNCTIFLLNHTGKYTPWDKLS